MMWTVNSNCSNSIKLKKCFPIYQAEKKIQYIQQATFRLKSDSRNKNASKGLTTKNLFKIMAMTWVNCKRTNTNFDWTWSRSVSYKELFLSCSDGACCLYHFITAFTFSQTSMAGLATSPFAAQRTAKILKKQKTKK